MISICHFDRFLSFLKMQSFPFLSNIEILRL